MNAAGEPDLPVAGLQTTWDGVLLLLRAPMLACVLEKFEEVEKSRLLCARRRRLQLVVVAFKGRWITAKRRDLRVDNPSLAVERLPRGHDAGCEGSAVGVTAWQQGERHRVTFALSDARESHACAFPT